MKDETEAPSPFLPGTNVQYALDSTSIGYFKTCPRLYYYTMIEGWQPKGESVHLTFGILYHEALHNYDILRIDGRDHEEAVFEVVKWLCESAEGYPDVSEAKPSIRAKSFESLLRTVVWYLDKYPRETDPAETVVLANGKPACELSFRFELDWAPSPRDIDQYVRQGAGMETVQPYLLCGHLDRVVNFQDNLFVMDRKAQPLSTKVLGLHGWIEIRSLFPGDMIAGRDGKFYEVKNLYPKGLTRVYRIEFNDGTSVLCADDHLWTVYSNVSIWTKTITTLELLNKPHYVKYCVPLCDPIQHNEYALPVHPYVVGALLGDGYLNGSSVVLSTTKQWLVDNIKACLKNDVIRKAPSANNDWIISGGETLNGLRSVYLMNKLARTKYVPDEYKFASEHQRRELLRGLMDTDGGWNDGSRIYDSMSLGLIEDICELVRSLGGTARYRGRNDGCYRASLRLPEWPTGIGHRYIKSVIEVDKDETVCIETSAPDGLYITENHTVTHNTTTSALTAYYFDQFSPNNQMSLYSIAGQIVVGSPVRGVIIDAAEVKGENSKSAGYSEFARGFTFRTPDQNEEWLDDLRVWTSAMEACATSGSWPMNEASCGNYGGCRFREVCSKSPSVRHNFLKSEFEQKTPWNPLAVRG